jgi:hypothetical protein
MNDNYKKLLLTEEWYLFSKEIKKRDKWKCVECESDKNLQAHHIIYRKGFKPWESPMDEVITLCKICHEKVHEKNKIKSISNGKIIKYNKIEKKSKSKGIKKYKGIPVHIIRNNEKLLKLKNKYEEKIKLLKEGKIKPWDIKSLKIYNSIKNIGNN